MRHWKGNRHTRILLRKRAQSTLCLKSKMKAINKNHQIILCFPSSYDRLNQLICNKGSIRTYNSPRHTLNLHNPLNFFVALFRLKPGARLTRSIFSIQLPSRNRLITSSIFIIINHAKSEAPPEGSDETICRHRNLVRL